MIFVNKNVTDLAEGYQKIHEAEKHLLEKWKDPLMAVYAGQQTRHSQAKIKHQRRLKALGQWLPLGYGSAGLILFMGIGSWLISGIADNGFVILLAQAGIALIPLSILLSLVLGTIWVSLAYLFKPTPPQHPLKSPLKEQLFKPLFPAWQAKLNHPLPTVINEDGDNGENEFIRQLNGLLDDSYFLLNKLCQDYGEDVDVVVVGPSGIWVFEVKYWSGEIIWQDGRWDRRQSYHGERGRLVEKKGQISQPPDQQWRRVADQVRQTLRKRASQTIFTTPDLAKRQGGIVFTHPKARYHISGQAPFAWGPLAKWRQQFQTAPTKADFSEQKRVQILNALLARHQQLSQPASALSMAAYADHLAGQADASLKQWVNQHQPVQPGRN